MPDNREEKPFFRGHSHQAMFFVAIGASGLLVAKTNNTSELIAIITYCIGLLMMLGVSALYHRIYWSPKNRALIKRFDYSAIFVMIAAGATPFAVLALSKSSGIQLMILIWVVAILGILQALFFNSFPKILRALIYVMTGAMVIPFLPELMIELKTKNIVLILVSGLIYSIGAVGYALKWPRLDPRFFGYHEYFHMLVNIATILHFLVVYSLID